MADATDLRSALAEAPMTPRQWLAVALCVAINVIDGYEILAAGYTAPAIGQAFGLSPTLLGVFLAGGPAGMILGALALAPLADVIGRRRLALACLVVAATGMAALALLTNAATGLPLLVAARVVTGIGVGAMMVAVNTVAAEVSNTRRRDLSLVLQATGFPLGGALGGLCATLLPPGDWRVVYGIGAVAALALLPAVARFLPESIDFLLARRPADALHRLQRLAAAFRLPVPDTLPPPVPRPAGRTALADLATPQSLAICTSFCLMMASFYFLASWTPKLLAAAGSLRLALSGAALVAAGGVAGDLAFAALSLRWRAVHLGPLFALACFAAAAALAVAPSTLVPVAAFVLGFFLYGTMASHYALVPAAYPARLRASGTGLAVGIGRIGATIGPLLGGIVLARGATTAIATVAMTLPLLGCVLLLRVVGRRTALS